MTAISNLIGKRFGRLLVIDRASNNKRNRAMWICLCDCGTIVVVDGSSLQQMKTTSCGCYYIESRTGENNVAKRPEVRAKISKGLEGRYYSSETRAKIGAANRGENSGKWIEDRDSLKSTEIKRIRESPEQREWAADVKGRDYHTCQGDCGGHRGGNLQSHHILSFSKYPELRLLVSNGITLCITCHRKIRGYEEEMEEYYFNKLFNFK